MLGHFTRKNAGKHDPSSSSSHRSDPSKSERVADTTTMASRSQPKMQLPARCQGNRGTTGAPLWRLASQHSALPRPPPIEGKDFFLLTLTPLRGGPGAMAVLPLTPLFGGWAGCALRLPVVSKHVCLWGAVHHTDHRPIVQRTFERRPIPCGSAQPASRRRRRMLQWRSPPRESNRALDASIAC